LHWVSKRINTMKGDMTHEEFLAACRLVTSLHPPPTVGADEAKAGAIRNCG
jgi:hypothetical protein